jgi:CheY-like chemotaxis protein
MSEQGPLSATPAGPAGRRVLLVEDNDLVAYSLASVLRRAGFRVDVAHTGSAALEAAAARPPDVALVDLGLPDMDGYGLARLLREREGLRGVALVALTGCGGDDSRRRSEEAGFAHHVSKPVDPGELRRLVLAARGADSV